jgi:adenylate kinase
MIIFFGPAGAGKSVQGQILAARHGWRWLSAGQLLRDTHDAALIQQMQTGDLLPNDTVNTIMSGALLAAKDIASVILDGYPRELDQAKWLVDNKTHHGRDIKLAIVLEVPRSEIVQRLAVRGRADDTPEVIDRRLNLYRGEIYPILDFLNTAEVPIVHIDGVGTVGEVHDKIEAELVDRGIVKEVR